MRPIGLNYPPNPDYGDGACRRSVRLDFTPGQVLAHLYDSFHEMTCILQHDGKVVTGLESRPIRVPTTACGLAGGQLQPYVGLSIGTPPGHFYHQGEPLRHCTHLLDLFVMALRHADRSHGSLRWDAIVPDETDAPVTASVSRDGRAVHAWLIRDGQILAPGSLAGRTLDKGFATWAVQTFNEDDFETAMVLARTWLIALGRRYATKHVAGRPVSINPAMKGRCFAFNAPQFENAIYLQNEL
ncbi:hypothetical protein [Novosphingobium rosa]|uniref:hypothetical protein n=1 Tax=Novosphingobium rosa TaxID=76978 RepID=UPI000830DDE6|nr:hypothetical protein [Novosphingobium rosa]